MSAPSIPQALKQADITRFANRASQLKAYKPVISYWCNYHILEQILARKLHTQDEECLQYTTSLMDELESFKADNAQNDTVTDDVASQAYVEQFAFETLQRAENAMRANRATLQTADTLQAAATFFELLQIWGQLDAEVSRRIKFAKYHALRIAKALKNGEDPNLTNPQVDELVDEPLDSADPDVQAITQSRPPESTGDIMAAEQGSLGKTREQGDSSSATRQTAGASRSPSPPIQLPGVMDLDASHPQQRKPSAGLIPDLPAAPSDLVSPASSRIDSPTPDAVRKRDADNKTLPPAGMPSITNPLNANTTAHLQDTARTTMTPPPTSLTPSNIPSAGPRPGSGPRAAVYQHGTSSLAKPPLDSSSMPLPPDAAPVNPAVPISSLPRPSISAVSGIPGPPASAVAPLSTSPAQSPIPPPTLPSGPSETLDVDDHNITEAQKHARWAVSALSFDDVPTAIRELKIALGHLGSQ